MIIDIPLPHAIKYVNCRCVWFPTKVAERRSIRKLARKMAAHGVRVWQRTMKLFTKRVYKRRRSLRRSNQS